MSKPMPQINISQPTQVTDAGDLRKYRTELPNLIDDLGLSMFAYRLYGHLKRRAGPDGTTIEGLRSMARHCQMAVGPALTARRELIDRNLIAVEEVITAKGKFDRITLADIWEQNFLHYAEIRRRKAQPLSDGVYHEMTHPPAPPVREGVPPGDTGGVSPHEQGVSRDVTGGVSPDDTLKKELKKEGTKEELTHTAPPPKAPPNGKQPCVCETPHRSKICDEERIRIASNTEGIHSPERYAMTLEARRGTYDTVFLKRQRELQKPGALPSPLRDISACPDCRGHGFWYPAGDTPEGRKKGTQKCLHSRLDETLNLQPSAATSEEMHVG